MDLSILIVDDNVILNTVQKTLFKSIWPANNPIACFDVESALQTIEQEIGLGKKLLLLLDIHMPVMDGWELLDILTQKTYVRDVWIILNTSSENLVDELRAKNYHQIIAFNKKPLSRKLLIELMQRPPLSQFF